ncbi:Por secretion system C-terminal sorting domain-containing protein [Chryseobacterium oleae]|uniref:Por secretion system C-terminal sorting domain-containing protein n=1 Tax=Chryseobacterium oleae TaxID=491207 RepID=A0A1I4WNA9_CHROL|nr:T9SS type A sorting domain-containing protein [Chryseobacterium oleae]SFN14673.1 Por secretion system C-terminal sorting domain-containing protein [Chryseobacterium oleae]
MKIHLPLRVLSIVTLFAASAMNAQNYQTMPVQSGYTADVIANDVGSALSSTTEDVDGVSFAFVARDFKLTPTSSALTYGLPVNGIVNSVVASTPGLSYKLGDLYGNNSLKISTSGTSGTLSFITPIPAFKVYMLATGGSGQCTVNVTVNFTDNTTQTFSGVSISDWYDGTNYAIRGIGRINRANNVLESSSINPRLYQALLTLDAANQTKPIQSITVTKVSGTGIANVFAFSADAYTDCVAPTLQPVGALTSSSAQVSWTVPATVQAVSYDVYYSTTNTAPTAATAPNHPGVTGTSFTIPSLSSSTVYYYWVRTNCSTATAQSVWSQSGTFTTLCGTVVPSYTNDFSTFPGTCWTSNLSGGTPATGPTGTSSLWASGGFLGTGSGGSATINLYSTNRVGWLKTLPFNLSAGSYKVKFDYGVAAYLSTASSPMGSDDVVQFVVSNDGGSTWTVLQTWNEANAPTNTSTPYSYTLTGYNSANTVFAFYATAGTVNDNPDYNFYVDNFTVENAQLSTSEVKDGVKKASVHPNPFKDILYISDTREVKSVTVGDASGRAVKNFRGAVKELDLSTLNTGLYFVTIYFKDGSQSTVKAIKK